MESPTISAPTPPLSLKEHYFVEKFDRNSPISSPKICKSFRDIKQIHCQMIKTGLVQLPCAATELIAAYCAIATSESLGYAAAAFQLLEEDGEADLFLWNTLIRGYSSASSVKEAIKLYSRLIGLGIRPDRFTFPPLLAACSKVNFLVEGQQIHGALVKMGSQGGIKDDVFTSNSLIHFYAEIGDMELAQRVFEKMTERNVVSWTSLIDGYASSDSPEKAVYLFHEMVRDGRVKPNSVTMACVCSGCAKLQDAQEGEKILSFITNSGIEMNPTLFNSVVDMLMKIGAVDEAERLFDECTNRNVILWNAMVSNYVHLGMANKVFAVFSELIHCGEKPDRITIATGVSASTQLSDVKLGKQFHGYILRNGFDFHDMVLNSLLDMYMKCEEPNAAYRVFSMNPSKTVVSWNTIISGCIANGDFLSARELFDVMPQRDLVSWNTMIAGFAQASQFEEAIELFRQMQASAMKPDAVTMVGIASACGHLGSLDLAKWTYAYIRRSSINCDVKLNTALVDMFAKCGDPKNSLKLFEKMPIKDVSAWTSAIGAAAIEGNGQRALRLLDGMIKHGLKPDGVVLAQVLTACSHGGLLEDGRRLFNSMSIKYGVSPGTVHYGCMVDLLGRAGLLEEARDLIQTMPMEPNDVIWGALLAASCAHQDFELAEHAAEQVLALAPERSGVHVLLANMYASAGRWQDVSRTRLVLNEKKIRKHPGCSLIEVDGAIHEFTSGDESHTQRGSHSRNARRA